MGAVSAVMLVTARVLRDFFDTKAQLPPALKDDPIVFIVLDILGGYAHTLTYAVETILILGRGEE